MLSTEIQTINAFGAVATEYRYEPETPDDTHPPIAEYLTINILPYRSSRTYHYFVGLVNIATEATKGIDLQIDKEGFAALMTAIRTRYDFPWECQEWWVLDSEF